MRKLNWISIFAIIVLAGCGGGNAGPQSTSASGAKKKRVIAVIPKSTANEFWTVMEAGAKSIADECNAEIVYKAGEPGDDHNAQLNLIDRLLGQVDGIVLAPTHKQFLMQAVTKAKERGVPVAIVDSGVDSDKNDYVSYIATNNRQGGVECARAMGKLLNGKGSIIFLKYQAGSESTMQREDGFRETLAKEFPNIKILQEKYGNPGREEALKNSQMLIAAQPEFDGVFACNESTAYGMLMALRERGLADKVKFVGFDSAKELVDAMEKGHIHALAVQSPFKMGVEGVRAVTAALDKKPYPKEVDTGITIVTPENLKQPEIQKLVDPLKK